MTEPSGIRFSESLSGYIGEGEDFRKGYRAGLRAGGSARFWVTVTIPDLDSFLADPEHVAEMTGRVRLTGLGSARVKDGRLHLFCRRDGATRMLYYLPFSLNGVRYLLWGEKRLRRASGGEAWRQMTTLYTELVREDPSEAAKQLARGIMRIGPEQVALQALSFRSVNAGDPITGMRNIARFLRFSSAQGR